MTADHPYTKKVREDIWNHPSKDMLTDEQKASFKDKGESMYNPIDLDNLEESTAEAVAYTVMQLRSGMEPDNLQENEKALLHKVYGDDWPSLNFSDLI